MRNDSIDLEHLAKLAMLEIPDERVKSFTEDLCNVLKMAENLPELEDVPGPMASDVENMTLREDAVLPSLPRDVLLQNAPQARDGFFVAPNPIE